VCLIYVLVCKNSNTASARVNLLAAEAPNAAITQWGNDDASQCPPVASRRSWALKLLHTPHMAHASLRFLPETPEIVRLASVGKVDELRRVVKVQPASDTLLSNASTPAGSSTNLLQEAYLDLRTPLHIAASEYVRIIKMN
jgi:hypothetical protein